MIESITSEIAKDKEKYIKKICDSTNLKDGLHIKVNIDNDFNEDKVQYYLTDDKNSKMDIQEEEKLKDYFKSRQLLSGLMNDDANKALDTPRKKSLGTVYISLAFNNECSPYNENTENKKKFQSSEEMISHFQDIVYKKLENIGDEIEKTFKIDILQRTLEKEKQKIIREEEKLKNLDIKLKDGEEKLNILIEKDSPNTKIIKQKENIKKLLEKYDTQKEKFEMIKTNLDNLKNEELAYCDIKNIINDAREEEINGIVETSKVGYVKITDNKKAKYYFERVKTSDSEEYKKLMELAEKIQNEYNGMDMYSKVQTGIEFNDLYSKLVEEANWQEVEKMTIAQPESKIEGEGEGDKYVVLLKKVAGNDVTTDAQFLTASYNYEPSTEKEKIITQETTKLPITYDGIALIVALVIVVGALTFVAIRMKKINKDEQK